MYKINTSMLPLSSVSLRWVTMVRIANKYRVQLLIAVVMLFSIAAHADYKIQHLEPESWWAGMKTPHLQLLVHGERIADLSPEVNYPGIRIENIQRVANPNYLFIDMILADDVKPGEFLISFKRDDVQKLSHNYRLHERESESAERVGFSQADVIYLITPDRFVNGDRRNDRVESMQEGPNRSDKDGRHGGDLRGVINNLDYIADMGFTQIWLNPVLENNQPEQSYHGYATTDYYRVDPRYGSNALYRELSAAARQRGLGLIMDMIPNHSGSEHWWMKDLPSDDWINHGGKFAPTSHKRETLHDPHAVEEDRQQFSDGWFVPTMPDLNQRNPLMANYLIQNSIWWVEYAGLSGIRVDTYSYPDKDFLTEWTRRLMQEYPCFSIVGEEWSLNPAIVSYWQRGKQNDDGYISHLPSLMDFPLQHAVIQGLISEESWNSGLTQIYEVLANDFLYAEPHNLMVFPDNHDMDRIYTQLDEEYDLYKMAMVYFLTTRGIPQLYYGTEILMTNAESGDHGIIRSDFPGGWPGDKVNAFTGEGLIAEQKDAQAWMRRLLNWRKSSKAIHHGELTHYVPAGNTYVYFRHHGDEKVMVILNKDNKRSTLKTNRFRRMLEANAIGTDVMTGKRHDLGDQITLAPRSAMLLVVD